MVRILVTYWLYFLFRFLSGIIWTLCEKIRLIFVSRTFAVYHEFFFKYIFVRVLVVLIQKGEMGNRDAVKVCVNVEIKFWFMQKSYYLIILVLRWKMLPLILENDLLLSRNQLFCFKKLKLVVQSSRIHYFSLKFCACVLLAMLTKIFSVLLCSFNEKSENLFSWRT